MRLDRLVLFAALSTSTMSGFAYAQELPDGQGKTVVQSACTQCHGLDVILSQRRSREDWTEVVTTMVGNGLQLSDDDYNQVIEYLATYLGPASPNASSAAAGRSGKQDK
jgi:cytochrome c553